MLKFTVPKKPIAKSFNKNVGHKPVMENSRPETVMDLSMKRHEDELSNASTDDAKEGETPKESSNQDGKMEQSSDRLTDPEFVSRNDSSKSNNDQCTWHYNSSDDLVDHIVSVKLGIPTSQQQQLQQQQLLQQQIQVLPDSATAAASTSPSPYTQMIGTQATSMPSNTEYPGQYGFEVCFGKQQKETKSTTWTYSESLKKLFANLASLCPIKFRCSKSPPPGSVIRALPIYMQPEHIQEPVSRCPNHITKEDPNRDHKSHLIRCENPNTVYYTDQLTNRESLTIPFEEPQAGSDTSVSLFQFMCYSSCVGGLNRRPIQIIFTLETPTGHVIARRVCEVRICACPGRDRKAEEDGATPGNKKSNKKSKNVRVNQVVTTVGPPAKKRKLEDEEVFTLHVRGRENYEVLLKLRDSLELASKVPQPEVEKHNRDYDEINRRHVGEILDSHSAKKLPKKRGRKPKTPNSSQEKEKPNSQRKKLMKKVRPVGPPSQESLPSLDLLPSTEAIDYSSDELFQPGFFKDELFQNLKCSDFNDS